MKTTDQVLAEHHRKIDMLADKRPCPFCGSTRLALADWIDDDGEFDAIECLDCKGAAPATTWNIRRFG